MRRLALRLYLVLGAAAVAAYPTLPAGLLKDTVYYCAIGLSAAVAIVVGVRMLKPRPALPWYLFAAGQLLFVLGDVMWSVYEYALHREPFPSPADALYLAGYPLLAAGLLLLIRARSPGRDWASLIDAAILAAGLAVLSWIFLIIPYARDPSLSLAERLISSAYPLADVLLLAVAVRLLVGPGTRNPSYWLVVASVLALLVGDVFYGLLTLADSYAAGSPLDTAWLASYVLWGAAALHPSMRALAARTRKPPPRLRPRRLALLAGASLTAPAALAIQTARGQELEVPVVVGGSVMLFLLALIRVAGVVAGHERAVRRESVLRRAATVLVGMQDRPEICQAAAEAATSLAGGPRRSGAALAVQTPSGLEVATAGQHAPAEVLERALTDGSADLRIEPFAACGQAGAPATLIVPIAVGEEVRGWLGIATERPPAPELADALETLTAQVALALEGAAAAEERHLRRSETRFRSLVQHSSDVIALIDPDLTIRYQSPSVEPVLGYEPSELVGTRLAALLVADDVARALSFYESVAGRPGPHPAIELRLRRQDGALRHVEIVSNNLLADPDVGGIVLTIRDVTERKVLEEQLTHQAFHDPLTGLANRALFADRVEHALARDTEVTVLFVDLDDFKTVNDSLGHAAGDELLVAVAERLASGLRPGDTCARLGGDEFAILLEDMGAAEGARAGRRLLEALHSPFLVQGKQVFVYASAGLTASAGDSDGASDLLRNADAAMYRAKSQGKGRLEVFKPSMHRAAVARLELKAELERAVEQQEFVVHFQPIVALETGAIEGVEALARWRRPGRGLIAPDEFIALAEETGLILPIGRYVLEEACRRGREWQLRHRPAEQLMISVNLSGRQLLEPEVIDLVRGTLEQTGLEPKSLVLEITESALMRSPLTTGARLRELKELGVRLAIDDFGTGYSSLSRLDRFPIDVLKIAKPFVDGAGRRREERRLTEAIFRIGHTLDLQTVAEGVETAEQHARLLELGCDLGQGFYFSRPLDPRRLGALLGKENARLWPGPLAAGLAG